MDHFKAVIFDMDGLLLDTETIAARTFLEACRAFSYEPDLKIYYRCVGTTWKQTREILTSGFGPGFDYDSIYPLWQQKYRTETEEKPVPLKEGVPELLDYLSALKMTMAVVTSTRRSVAVSELTLAGIIRNFQFVLGGDQITRGKPDPEIYQKASRELDLHPSGILVLEDSDAGVLSAYHAGLQVIQVPDIVAPAPQVRALGHRVMKSLKDVRNFLKEVE